MTKLSPIKEFAQDHMLGGGQVGIWIKQVLALELPPSSALQRHACRGWGCPSAQRAMKALWQEARVSTDVKVGRALRLGEQREVGQRSKRQEAEVLVTLAGVSPLAVLLGEGVTLLTSPWYQ